MVDRVRAADPDILRFLIAAEPAVLRESVGLCWLEARRDRMVQQLKPPASALEANATVPIGLLAALTDSTVGSAGAVAAGYGFAATLGLHVELAGPLPDGLNAVVATSSVVRAGDSGSLATAILTTPSGETLGWASMRAVTLQGRAAVDGASSPAPIGVEKDRLDGIDSLLGVDRIDAADRASRLEVTTRPELANGAGRLHGGIVAAIAQRAAHHAIVSTTGPDARVRHLVLDVDMFRPVSPGRARVEAHGVVRNRTRRFVWAESEVLLSDSRIAARARTLVSVDAAE